LHALAVTIATNAPTRPASAKLGGLVVVGTPICVWGAVLVALRRRDRRREHEGTAAGRQSTSGRPMDPARLST
jgi:hypothetical protein